MRSLLIPSLVVILPLLLTGGAPAQDETKAIIDKAIKAHGGAEKLAKEGAAQGRTKGTLEIAGMSLSFTEQTSTQSNRLKSVLELEVAGQNIKVTTVFNGEKAWINDPTGKTTELDG